MAVIEVVKYNGASDIFAWKYPSEELGTWTQLIVNESQEAVLYKGGKALDVFPSGRHTLSTQNIPLLNHIINLPFGKRSPFTAEVWYVNKLFKLDITASPIQIQDPKYGVFLPVRSNGIFGIQIEDSKKFLVKLVGTLPVFDEKNIVQYFRGIYVTKVKDAISTYIVEKTVSVLEINVYLNELSEYIKECIEPEMSEYGIKLVSFYINEISVPEEDLAVRRLKNALAKRAEMNLIGYNYQQERSFDTMQSAARNHNTQTAPFMGAGMGLGMGVGFGRAMSNMTNQVVFENSVDNLSECSKCHVKLPKGQRFCGSCGYDMETCKEEKSEKKVIHCSKCGAVHNGSKFCPECGKKYISCPECGADMNEDDTFCKECNYKLPKKCPKCGTALTGNIKFCPECGECISKICPNCKMEIDGEAKFCANCGEKLR